MVKSEGFKGSFRVWLLNLVSVFRKVTQRLHVPIEAYERLGSPEGVATIEKIVHLIHADWLAKQPTFPEDHYRVYVSYAPMPSRDDLKKKFGEQNVSQMFDRCEWELHASCQGMDRTPGEKTFYLHAADSHWESEERITWGLKQRTPVAPNGYRPATLEEEYEFAMAHPELVDYVGLGSFAMCHGHRRVVSVQGREDQRFFDDYWVGMRWNRRIRVLLVSI